MTTQPTLRSYLLFWFVSLFPCILLAQASRSSIEVILEDAAVKNASISGEGALNPSTLATEPLVAGSPKNSASRSPSYRVSGITLNEFAQVMAQKAGLSYVRNPLIDTPGGAGGKNPLPPGSSLVEGNFNTDDPLVMLRAVARAHGYKMIVENGLIELQNSETEKALPQQTYSYTFRYLRFPRYNLTSDTSTSSSTSTTSSSGTSESAGASGGKESFGANMESADKKTVDFFRGLLSPGAYINYNAKSNTLVARDIDANIRLLDAMIRRLDVEKPNVLTAVTALEVEANPRSQLGFDWKTLGGTGTELQINALNSLNEVFFPGQNVIGLLGSATAPKQVNERTSRYAAVVTPTTIRTVMRALQTKGLAEIRARFFVCTEDNEVGRTRITSDFPILKSYETSSSTTNGGSGGQPTPKLENADIGNTIEVIPQLLPNNMVRLQIKPILRTLGDQRAIELGQPVGTVNVDVVQNRTTDVTVRVPLNKSLILGGLNQLFFTDSSSKVPILGDLPLLKFFFSSKDYSRQRRNLVLIVEPSILDPNDPASLDQATQEAKAHIEEDKKQPYLPLDRDKIDRS